MVLILCGVFYVLFLVLNVGYLSNLIASKKIEVQEEARRTMDWIVKDLRQTEADEIKSNSPQASYLKFRIYSDYVVPNPIWSNYIEYSYDGTSDTLTRKDYGTNFTMIFHNITDAPFGIDQDWIDGDEDKLPVIISTQKPVRGSLLANFSLATEVKIRNE